MNNFYKLVTTFDELAFMSDNIQDIYSFIMIVQWKAKELNLNLDDLILYRNNVKWGYYTPLKENSKIYVYQNLNILRDSEHLNKNS